MTAVAAKPHFWRLPGVIPVFAMFFLEAFVLGNWIPRIPDVKLAFDFSASQLGLSLFVLASGTMVAFLAGGKMLKRWGLRHSCAMALPAWTLVVFAVPFMPNGMVLAVLLFLGGLSIGLLEVAMNTAADRLEKVTERRLMSKAHGFWSLGSLVGALVGGAIGGWGMSLAAHFSTVLIPTALIGLIFALYIPRADDETRKSEEKKKEATFKLPARGLMLLCLMPIGIMVVEGAFIDWSALFVRDVLAAGALARG